MGSISIKNFRSVLVDMYNGYPNYVYYGIMEKEVGDSAIDILERDGIINKVGKQMVTNKNAYRLGIEGIKLVEHWNITRLTNWIITLTIGLFVIGAAQLVLVYLQNPLFN